VKAANNIMLCNCSERKHLIESELKRSLPVGLEAGAEPRLNADVPAFVVVVVEPKPKPKIDNLGYKLYTSL